jgi:hypothetical protein
MVRKAIVHACTVLVLVLLMAVSASAQTTPSTSTDSSKKTTTTTTKKTTYSSKASTKKGQMCGGIAGLTCPEGQACRYPTNQCNVADLSGTCVKVKSPCPSGGAKVCGCDGKTYNNECELLTAGVREASKGACPAAASGK